MYKRKTKIYNYNKLIIKRLWDAQDFLKQHFLGKKKWTIKKYKTHFKKWYKKNPIEFQKTPKFKLFEFFFKLNLVLSLKELKLFVEETHVLLNFKPINVSALLNLNLNVYDTLSLPLNWSITNKVRSKVKAKIFKKYNKLQYLRFKNIQSQWRKIRKKPSEYPLTLLSFKSNIFKFVQFDYSTNTLAVVHPFKLYTQQPFVHTRHNLERLSTWRMKI